MNNIGGNDFIGREMECAVELLHMCTSEPTKSAPTADVKLVLFMCIKADRYNNKLFVVSMSMKRETLNLCSG